MSFFSRIKDFFYSPNTPHKPRHFDDEAYHFRAKMAQIRLDGVDVGMAYDIVYGTVYRLGILTKTYPLSGEVATTSHYSAGPLRARQMVFKNESLGLIFKDGKVGDEHNDLSLKDFELVSDQIRIGRCSIRCWNKKPGFEHMLPSWFNETEPGLFHDDVRLMTAICGVEIDSGFGEVNDQMRDI